MSDHVLEVSISAENQYSEKVHLGGKFNLSLSGTWVGNVTVQRSFDDGGTWLDAAEFAANGEYIGQEIEPDVVYRIGVKTGDYTSGTIIGRLSQ
jgi:hypothetical protein